MVEEFLWNVLAFILVIILMILTPIYREYEYVDEIIKYRVMNDANEFLNTIKLDGKISLNDFLRFENKINSYGKVYQFDLKYRKLNYAPIYEDTMNINTFEGDYKIYYEEFNKYDIENFLQGEKFYNLKHGDFIDISIKEISKSRAKILKENMLNLKLNNFEFKFSVMIE